MTNFPGVSGIDELNAAEVTLEELLRLQERHQSGLMLNPFEAINLVCRHPFEKELGRWVTADQDMSDVKEQIRAIQASQTREPTLITGPTGTGKELLARCLTIPGQPFVPQNCGRGSLPPELAASIFFGYVKGAFTGANMDRRGLLVEAGKGIIFLDEIGQMTLDVQGIFLRAIQEGEIRPLGSLATIKIECQFIAATNMDLKSRVEADLFLPDLYSRLRTIELNITGLKERPGDILLIANAYDWPHEIPDFMLEEIYVENVRAIQRYIKRMKIFGYYNKAHKMLLSKQDSAALLEE